MSPTTIEQVVRMLGSDPPGEELLGSRDVIAAAALMVECARAHPAYEPSERVAIATGVQKLFGLSPDVAEVLVGIAEEESAEGWQEAVFTTAVKQGFDLEKRTELVQLLCDVALADGVFQMREALFIRHIASELGVSEDSLSIPTAFVA